MMKKRDLPLKALGVIMTSVLLTNSVGVIPENAYGAEEVIVEYDDWRNYDTETKEYIVVLQDDMYC